MYKSDKTRTEGQGNGVAVDFPVDMQIYDVLHLEVWQLTVSTASLVKLTRGLDYTVTLYSDLSGALVNFIHDLGGGPVIYAPAIGIEFVFLRKVPLTQDVDLKNYGAQNQDALEQQLDLIVMGLGQLSEELSRSVKVDVSETGGTPDELLETIAESRDICSAAAVSTAADMQAAIAAKDTAVFAKDEAAEWAENPEDTPVTGHPGEYSALHWAAKAAGFVVPPQTNHAGAFLGTDGASVSWIDSPPSRRNRMCNGDYRVGNIYAGGVVPLNASGYFIDCGGCFISKTGKITAQRTTDILPFSMLFESQSNYASLAGDYFIQYRPVEGLDWADMGWGTANALPCTVSFAIIVSVPGLYSFSVGNPAGTRSYIFTKTLSSGVNYVSETVPGCTDGVWPTGAVSGLNVNFDLGCGSDFEGTAGSWLVGNYFRVAGSTRVVATLNATYSLGTIQIERGSFATPFEVLPYQQAEAWCQRYHPTITPSTGCLTGSGVASNTTHIYAIFPLSVPSRSVVTGVIVGTPAAILPTDGAANFAVSAATFVDASLHAARLVLTTTGATQKQFYAVVAQGITKIHFTGAEL